MDIEEKKSLMKSLGMADSGLNRFITQGFKLLNLLSINTS